MLIKLGVVLPVFRKVAQVRAEMDEYLLSNGTIPVPIEDLQSVVIRMYEYEIDKIEVFVERGRGQYVRAMLLIYNVTDVRRALIMVVAGQSEPWKRFAAAKELCHLVIDETEDWSHEGTNTLEALLTTYQIDLVNGGTHLAEGKQVLSEVLAEIAATEVLYPRECRAADIQALSAGQTTLAALEARYKIPRAMIQRSHLAPYLEMCQAVDEELGRLSPTAPSTPT